MLQDCCKNDTNEIMGIVSAYSVASSNLGVFKSHFLKIYELKIVPNPVYAY